MPADGAHWDRRARLPSLERMVEVVKWIDHRYPLEKVRITGGEPTLRRGLPELVRMLSSLPGSPEVAMTTNGVLLARLAPQLAEAGLARVNISLDSLDPERYREITRGGNADDAVAGIRAALDSGLTPIRLNSVLRRSGWRDDVPALLDFALENDVEVRFLELMYAGSERSTNEAPGAGSPGGGTARRDRIQWRGSQLAIGWITPVSRPFCASCNRLRLDAHGHLRRCLMDRETLPLLDLLESGDKTRAARRVARFLDGKVTPDAMRNHLPMVSLGG
jgi:cyclic pyranopterin phosphate synthase